MSGSAFWCPTCRTMRMDAVELRDGRDYAPAAAEGGRPPAVGGQPPDVRECHRCAVARERALWEAFEEFPDRGAAYEKTDRVMARGRRR
jgi:hypothetical protein